VPSLLHCPAIASRRSRRVENEFEQRLFEVMPADNLDASVDGSSPPALAEADEKEISPNAPPKRVQANGIDKSVLTIAAPRRYRNKRICDMSRNKPAFCAP
jgi:hypothetical protein